MPVSKRVRGDQVTWRARWRDDSGQQRSKSFRRKIDADRFMTSVQHALLAGEYVDPARGKLKVGEWAWLWLDGQMHLKPKTKASYRSLLRSCVLPRWERVALGRVRYGAAAEWVAQMQRDGLSASRTRQAYHLLTAMLDAAVKDGRLVRNPVRGVELPRLPTPARRYLKHDQLHALAEACGKHRLMVLLLGYCGFRWGEIVALRSRHVELDGGRIEVREAVSDVDGTLIVGTPKSHQIRYVPVPKLLCEGLTEQVADKSPDDLVFPNRDGGILRVQSFRRDCFDPAATKVGLDGLVPHELRHTAASLAIASGASVKSVQRMLGHASATLTLDRYGHLFDEELDVLAARLDDAMRDSGVVPVWSQRQNRASDSENASAEKRR